MSDIPWWHYFENVPNPGGSIPHNWIDPSIWRRVTCIDATEAERSQRKTELCRCGRRIRNSESTNYKSCSTCREQRIRTAGKLVRRRINADGVEVCTSCWARPPISGKKSCKRCLEHRRVTRLKKIEKERKNVRR